MEHVSALMKMIEWVILDTAIVVMLNIVTNVLSLINLNVQNVLRDFKSRIMNVNVSKEHICLKINALHVSKSVSNVKMILNVHLAKILRI